VTLLEKDKEQLENTTTLSIEELKKDKLTLREFLDIKEKTIEQNGSKIKSLEMQGMESKMSMA
jgi:hypothetical protein